MGWNSKELYFKSEGIHLFLHKKYSLKVPLGMVSTYGYYVFNFECCVWTASHGKKSLICSKFVCPRSSESASCGLESSWSNIFPVQQVFFGGVWCKNQVTNHYLTLLSSTSSSFKQQEQYYTNCQKVINKQRFKLHKVWKIAVIQVISQ